MQTILGANGVIGRGLAQELARRGNPVKMVSRTPRAVNPADTLFAADLTQREQTARAVEGAQTVYLTVGLPYDARVWQRQWPLIMDNVIAACQSHGVPLVFFDNIYLYGRVNGWMTEETPSNPLGKKGDVRAQVAAKVMAARQKGLKATIARSADFYGPGATLSGTWAFLFGPMLAGKPAQWLVDDTFAYTPTFVPDAVKALATLGLSQQAFERPVWHLPTAKPPFSAAQLIKETARQLGIAPQKKLLKPWMLRLVGPFNRPAFEIIEMLYQYDHDYLFDSSLIEKTFGLTPTPYREGIAQILRAAGKTPLP